MMRVCAPINAEVKEMPQRWKKLVGLVLILVWLAVYTLIAIRVGISVLPGAGWFAEFAYYAIAGLAWTGPLFPLISWMNRPGKGDDPQGI